MDRVTPNRKILIVDDYEPIHKDYRKILNRSASNLGLDELKKQFFGEKNETLSIQYEIDSAYNGEEALKKVVDAKESKDPYAMVFMDVRMPPGWDGIETTRRAWDVDPDLQVVICTAYGDYSWEEITRLFGPRDNLLFLRKPFDMTEVRQLALSLTEKWTLGRRANLKTRDLETIVQQRTADLDQQRAYLEAVFNSAHEGFLTVDAGENITGMNRSGEVTLGVEFNKTTPTRLDELLPETRNALLDAIHGVFSSNKPVTRYQIIHKTPLGEQKNLLVNAVPLQSEASQRNQVLLALRDITQLLHLEEEVKQQKSMGDMIGNSPAMQKVFRLIDDIATMPTTVLVNGESGTGKDLVASTIHKMSDRWKKPFVTVNCASLNDDLLASELFGHVKGAFTGALTDRDGRFKYAQDGTIFLDEIGDISPKMQASLLRILETGEYERAGDSRTIKSLARVIAATNRDLQQKVADGTFREDLYYRLNVFSINVPPLRNRMEDVPLLVEHFRKHCNRLLSRNVRQVDPETMELLLTHQWPGNIRELKNALERAIVVCHEDSLKPYHLTGVFQKGSQNQPPAEVHQPAFSRQPSESQKRTPLDKARVKTALENAGWNVSQAARDLGVVRQHLHRLIKKFDIER